MSRDASEAGPRLIADIGGTRSRFALSEAPGRLGPVVELPTPEAPPAETLRIALDRLGPRVPVRSAALAVAGPVSDGRARLTNVDWDFDAACLASEAGIAAVTLINDFEAVAYSLPLLTDAERRHVGGGVPAAGRATASQVPILVLGPGTGLGLASTVPNGAGGWTVAAGEGGHVTLPARTDAEWRAIARLGQDMSHVSAERFCSGPGLSALYAVATAPVLDEAAAPDAAEIGERARQGEARATLCLEMFADFLGTVASDAALTLGARGGVYLAGGVLPGLDAAFDWNRFHRRFTDKGRFTAYLEAIPVYRLLHPQPGLLGLTALP